VLTVIGMTTITALTASGDADLVAAAPTELPPPLPHEAIVAVEAFSVNRGEILLLAAGRNDGHGKDIAGRVIAQAADGSGPTAGTRVVAHLDAGGWAERVNVDARRLVALPDTVSTAAAAALPLPGLTALRMVRLVRAERAQTVLLTGASGGVGHLFCELAAAYGIAVTAVVRTPDRGEHLAAARVVTDVAGGGTGFDVALDSVGGPVTGQALKALRSDGLLIWFGQASGEPAQLDFFEVMNGPRNVRLRNFLYWQEARDDPADLAALVQLTASGSLHPEIGLTAPWTRTPEALAAVRDRRIRGEAILEIAA
jgi:NADPH2:quinone reductase